MSAARKTTEKATEITNIFQWNIKDFRSFVASTAEEKSLTSTFVGKSLSLPNSFWKVIIYPTKDITVGSNLIEDYLGVRLYLKEEVNEQNPVIKVRIQLCLLGVYVDNHPQTEVYNSGWSEAEFGGHFGLDCGWGPRDNIAPLSDFIENSLFNPFYLCDGVLRVKISLQIKNELNEIVQIVSPMKDQLQTDFMQLLDSKELSDVSIVTKDLVLKAHKNILSCRSPVFAAMFRTTMSESLTNKVNIKEFNSWTVRGMLQFIYGGNVEAVKNDYIDLLKISDMYQLEALKTECIKTAISRISSENVIELLIIGDKYNAQELKSKAMDFMNSNKSNCLFSPDSEIKAKFNEFAEEYPKLILELYKNIRNNSDCVNYSQEVYNNIIEETTTFTTICKLD